MADKSYYERYEAHKKAAMKKEVNHLLEQKKLTIKELMSYGHETLARFCIELRSQLDETTAVKNKFVEMLTEQDQKIYQLESQLLNETKSKKGRKTVADMQLQRNEFNTRFHEGQSMQEIMEGMDISRATFFRLKKDLQD